MGEMIVHGIKVAFWISMALILMAAIQALLNLLTAITFGGIIDEVLGIISMCLPFDAAAVFSAIGTVCSAILAFLIAQKIYDYATTNNPFTS